MPNIWTHILFAEEVADSIGYSLLKEEQNFYRLGAQGPDPFFYHNFWPWKKHKPVTAMGHALHYRACGPFLMDFIQYGKKSTDGKVKAYIMGFVTHHLLDRNTHPYIIYRSGNEGSKHTKLETIIDTLMIKRVRGMDTWTSPVYKQVHIGSTLYSPIRQILAELINKHYPSDASQMPKRYIDHSYKQMILALKVLYDRYGWKNRILKDMVSSYSHTKVKDTTDYLNLDRIEWHLPTDKNEASRASFVDLYEIAKKDGEVILPLILNYWSVSNDANLAVIREKIGNISYDTGKDCTLGLKNVYFNPIL